MHMDVYVHIIVCVSYNFQLAGSFPNTPFQMCCLYFFVFALKSGRSKIPNCIYQFKRAKLFHPGHILQHLDKTKSLLIFLKTCFQIHLGNLHTVGETLYVLSQTGLAHHR